MPRRVSFPVDLERGAREGRKRANAALKRRMGPKSHLSQFGSPIDSLEERRRASSPALCSELRSRSSYALVSATILFSRRLREAKIFQWHHTLNLELISPPHRERPSFGPKKGIWERLAAESDVSKQFSQAGCSAACRLNFFHQTTMAFLEVWLRSRCANTRQYRKDGDQGAPPHAAAPNPRHTE